MALGGLSPGLQKRLASLGYACEANGVLDPTTLHALLRFQADHDLPTTGEVDAATEDRVRAVFGAYQVTARGARR
jgi:peptidoglycan hydrolase-like protein with peptidoglycan-binding domain